MIDFEICIRNMHSWTKHTVMFSSFHQWGLAGSVCLIKKLFWGESSLLCLVQIEAETCSAPERNLNPFSMIDSEICIPGTKYTVMFSSFHQWGLAGSVCLISLTSSVSNACMGPLSESRPSYAVHFARHFV